MDRRLKEAEPGAPVTIKLEGEEVPARAGETVAVALFASGEKVLSRSIKYHRPRGFFCLEGHCGACLMRIDGRPNIKACREPVRDGMSVERQNAWPRGGFDMLAAADIFFPKGMDHHTMFTSPRALNEVMQKVVRQLGGLGRLPDLPPEGARTLPAARVEHLDVAIVGAGPAGLACATELARARRKVLIVDEQDRAGGSYLADPRFGTAAADRAIGAARAAGVELASLSTVIAWYPEDAPKSGAPPGLLAVSTPDGLLKLTAERYVYATGGYDQNLLFANNDRPGVLSARAVGRLLVRFGVKPAERPIVVGSGAYAEALVRALADSGARVTRLEGATLVAAHGHSWVKSLEAIESNKKAARRIPCDLVAIACTPAPASELPRQHGVPVALSAEAGGFACAHDADGATATPNVFVAGDVGGYVGPEAAAQSGARVGKFLAGSF